MDFKTLEAYLDRLPEFGIPAADMAVYKDHVCVFRHMTGHRDYEGREPVTEQDLYNIYSNTKLVTVTATMQLVEQGKIALSDPVSKFLPAFEAMTYKTRGGTKPAKVPMTVAHLLTMTSGLSYGETPSVNRLLQEQGNRATTQELVNALAKDPLEFEPGDRWCYGRSHDVLGAVIEVASGVRLSEYLKQNIFQPLGMKHTTFDREDAYVKAHLSAYYNYDSRNKAAKPAVNVGDSGYSWVPGMESGGGGLISCTDDYVLLVDALANGGVSKSGNRILSEESIAEIKKPRLNLLQQSQFAISHFKRGYGYGLGVRTLIDKGYGARSPLGEFAWDGMTGGYGLVDTENHLAICYMQNVAGCDYAWHTVFPETRDMIYEILGIEE